MELESIFFGVAVTMHDNKTENYITIKTEKNAYEIELDVESQLVYISKAGFDFPVIVPLANIRRMIPKSKSKA